MFDKFWAVYPRKVAKKAAERAWMKLSEAEQIEALEAIPFHVKYWKACNTEAEFIPHASTWLNGWRFADELQMPVEKKVESAWWTSNASIEAKARELGVSTYGKTTQEVIELIKLRRAA